ncbi:MAG: hypothetical protein KME20_06695 [Kaiparowitsia implicata GSE-PSE-MK54-09C]|jgi:hypothetical protein|nr:hypothetical protein [Kaiparowitsia implicata GSE-PSE-MK54-09C]
MTVLSTCSNLPMSKFPARKPSRNPNPPRRRVSHRVKRRRSPVVLLAVLCLLLGLVLASPLRLLALTAMRQPLTVQDIVRTSLLIDRSVYLHGQVGDRAPLLTGQVYELSDATGILWVLSPNAGLQTGDQVTIRGKVRQESFTIAGQQMTEIYIEELQVLGSPTQVGGLTGIRDDRTRTGAIAPVLVLC